MRTHRSWNVAGAYLWSTTEKKLISKLKFNNKDDYFAVLGGSDAAAIYDRQAIQVLVYIFKVLKF